MAVSPALRRLMRIRDLQEEQSRAALEFALGELHRLEVALTATCERDRRGRNLLHVSAETGEGTDRLAGLEETRTASRHAHVLGPMVEEMGAEVTELRQVFLMKRVERRQAETLIREVEARESVEAIRRGQQSLDDWYNSRLFHETSREEGVKEKS